MEGFLVGEVIAEQTRERVMAADVQNLMNHPPALLVTKYMGSKKPILPFVLSEIGRWVKPGDLIVDLMAGTHTIGYALKPICRIAANDIQKYSLVIGRTLLNCSHQPPLPEELFTQLRRYYLHNLRHLSGLFAKPLELEQKFLYSSGKNSPLPVNYLRFCEEYPYYGRSPSSALWDEEFNLLFSPERVSAYMALNCLEPYSLFSLYYANAYLGVRQAAEVDSLRYAIDRICDEWLPSHQPEGYQPEEVRALLLTALIMVLNRINVGPGHWASIPRVKVSNWEWVVSQRRLSVIDLFHHKVSQLQEELSKVSSPYSPHLVTSLDFQEFLSRYTEVLRQAKVIYIDPPYSQAHYSRFYHILETLVLYDYPPVEHKGRYRKLRFQSVFAKKTKIERVLGVICEAAREAGAVLIISYSQGGVIKNDEAFRAILEKYYPSSAIHLRLQPTLHSRQGRAERFPTQAYLFTCLPH